MQESRLWLLNHIGNAFTISTNQSKFTQLSNTFNEAVTVKRVSATSSCAWAIGHDHRVYIYIFSTDVPVRVPDTTYENQRWSPIHGFSRKGMIGTDRNAWSDKNGHGDRPKESVRLPSSYWQWDGNWVIDDNLRGEVGGIEGWQYALDFPAVYSQSKQWNSFVRKRKWIRFRRFIATDIWARISDMEVVDKAECFIDISVGGFLMPTTQPGTISVWAITNNGNVYVRTNTHNGNPEGDSWREINLDNQHGVVNICVGVSNLVWAITWDGHALVRTHVTRTNIYGREWKLVDYPNEDTRLMHVAVGHNAVWALSREGTVWFRKGTWGDDMYGSVQSAVGTMWVEMVGEMVHIAVSANDQVFAIDKNTRQILFRTSVTRSDLTGKTWQTVSLEEDLSILEREGRLSVATVCSCCDNDDSACEYHRDPQDPFNTSSSSSTITSVFQSPTIETQKPFPIHSSSDSVSDVENGNVDVFQPVISMTVIPLTNSQQVDSSLTYAGKVDVAVEDSHQPAAIPVSVSLEHSSKIDNFVTDSHDVPGTGTISHNVYDSISIESSSSSPNILNANDTIPSDLSSSSSTTKYVQIPASVPPAEVSQTAAVPNRIIDTSLSQTSSISSPTSDNQIQISLSHDSGTTGKFSEEMDDVTKHSSVSLGNNHKLKETPIVLQKAEPLKKPKKSNKKSHHSNIPDDSSSSIVFEGKKKTKKHKAKAKSQSEESRSSLGYLQADDDGNQPSLTSIQSTDTENASSLEYSNKVTDQISTNAECLQEQNYTANPTSENLSCLNSETGNAADNVKENIVQNSLDLALLPQPELSVKMVKEMTLDTKANVEAVQYAPNHEDVVASDSSSTIVPNKATSKSLHFINAPSGSLDSSTDSDEIIDFVTDLMSDEEDGRNMFSATKENNTTSNKDVTGGSRDMCSLQNTPNLSLTLEGRDQNVESYTLQNQSSFVPAQRVDWSAQRGDSPVSQHDETSQQSPFIISRLNRSSSVGVESSCSESSVSAMPIYSLGLAQSRLSWRWLDVTSCLIENPAAITWLAGKSQGSNAKSKRTLKISLALRNDILEKLKDRNKREFEPFSDMEQAVKKKTWVKSTKMHVLLFGAHSRWTQCHVEIEQSISNIKEGCLSVQYCHKNSQKQIQIKLDDIICVKTSSNLDDQSTVLVYSKMTQVVYRPLHLLAASEAEAFEWVSYLCLATTQIWKVVQPVPPGVVWSCTSSGDVFVGFHSCNNNNSGNKLFDFHRCWNQHGGHMSRIETGPNGVTWALGFDQMPYVYNGGYGGAFNVGTTGMSDNLQEITDFDRIYVYENEKWFPVIGWCSKGMLSNGFHWLTPSGKSVESKDDIKLPSSKWHWMSDWTVDFNSPGGVNSKGWQFSTNLYGHFHSSQHIRDYYRRRRWTRTCRLTTQGPWQMAGSLKLLDISVQIEPVSSGTDPIAVWAVGANGNVLSRSGVTMLNPEGESWNHVATYSDKPYHSISFGGGYRVWGIASDGTAWFRSGVSRDNRSGKCWLQVVPPPPANSLLKQVTAGASSVWAVDNGDGLWRRENITPTFPEGTGWELVATKVKLVSVGSQDQVWIVAGAGFSKHKHEAGVIYKRVGITAKKPSGTEWIAVIGSGWSQVSVRGMSASSVVNISDMAP